MFVSTARRRRFALERLESRELLATFTVNSTADAGTGSLRAAIIAANGTPEADTINFAISGAGQKTIALSAPLIINGTMTIDGLTQPGSSANTDPSGFNANLNIILSGSGAGASASGLVVNATGVTIRGLIINGFAQQGILIQAGGSSRVESCMIGLTADGLDGKPNGGAGIGILNAGQNTIGGTAIADRNLISANALSGVLLQDTSRNVLLNNIIGLKQTALGSLANGVDGITLNNANDNEIGRSGAGNVISGNGLEGIALGSGSSRNLIRANRLGTDPSGLVGFGNTEAGVFLENALDNTIGGVTAGDRNLISGNGLAGILLSTGATNNVALGNLIGVDSTGDARIGNSFQGVRFRGGASSNTLGGSIAGAGNVISGNSNSGIALFDAATSGNAILGNYIGLSPSGADQPNIGRGISVQDAVGTIIGGTGTSGNVIAANQGDGISLNHAANTIIRNNLIGLDAAGLSARPNALNGIQLFGGTTGTVIGGTGADDGNLIAGNTIDGIAIDTAATTGTIIQGNRIGLDSSGAVRANGQNGIAIEDAGSTTIGGSAAGARNFISGNGAGGILLKNSSLNLIQGNTIGTNLAGDVRPNITAGVLLQGTSSDNTLAANTISRNGAQGIALGGASHAAGQPDVMLRNRILGNAIATNTLDGLLIQDASFTTIDGNALGGNAGNGVAILSGVGNAIRSNAIYDNALLGIALGAKGTPPAPLANDGGDADSGANNLQNKPVITAAFASAERMLGGNNRQRIFTVYGSIQSAPNTALTIQFFGGSATGSAQGRDVLGSTTVTTDAAGSASFTAVLSAVKLGGYPLPGLVTATATDGAGNTSEFATAAVASQAAVSVLSIIPINPPTSVVVGSQVVYTYVVVNHGPAFANDLVLLDVVPPGMTFLGGSSSQGVVQPLNGQAAALLGGLAPGATAVVNLIFRADTAGTAVHSLFFNAAEGATTNTVATVIQPPAPPPPPPSPLLHLTRAAWTTPRRGGTQLVLTFDRALFTPFATFSPFYRVVVPGRDKRFGTVDDRVQKLKTLSLDPTGKIVTLTFRARLNTRGSYQLTVTGGPAFGVMDTALSLLDGDRNGTAGGDAIVPLTPNGTVVLG